MNSAYASSSSEEKMDESAVCLQSISENIFETLKCLICGECCHSPFKVTSTGHLVCTLCRYTLKEPTLNPQRIFVLEKMYELLEFPCKYNSQGCKFMGKGTTLKEHHKFCKYVSVICPFKDCRIRTTPKGLFDHFERRHGHLKKIDEPDIKIFSFLSCSSHLISVEHNIVMVDEKLFSITLLKNYRQKFFCYSAFNMEPFDLAEYVLKINFMFKNGQKTVILIPNQTNNMTREEGTSTEPLFLPFDAVDEEYEIRISRNI